MAHVPSESRVLRLAMVSTFIGLLLAVGILVSGYIWLECIPISQERLDALATGMSKQEVSRILGDPTAVYNKGERWVYSKKYMWNFVCVTFDERGGFVEYYIDN